METFKRTDGDGMEKEDNLVLEDSKFDEGQSKKISLRDKFIYTPEELRSSCNKPPNISGKMVQMRPAPIIVKSLNKKPLQGKEPKFVPYEPYKGAVRPIGPLETHVQKKTTKKKSVVKAEPLEQECVADNIPVASQQHTCFSDHNVQELVQRLQKENQQLDNQLKFQIQVNGDLKNLLVASVGEDMETRVHILTEDKLHLAHALLNSAQKLNTHQEQTEWLAGQCEVWRSKFLASSIMVEELAKWKALLTRRVQDLHDATQLLLDERLKVREYLISIFKDLSLLCDNYDVTGLRSGVHKLNNSSILDLSEQSMQLSAVVKLQLLGNTVEPASLKLPQPATTAAEALAMELIKHPIPELENADAAYSAVMGAAVAVNSTSPIFSPACCGHCTGQVKTV